MQGKSDELDFLSDPLSANTQPFGGASSDPFSSAKPSAQPTFTQVAAPKTDPFAAPPKPAAFTPAPISKPATSSADPFASISANIDTKSMFSSLGQPG